MASNYERVYEAILNTDDGKALVEHVRKTLLELRVVAYTFNHEYFPSGSGNTPPGDHVYGIFSTNLNDYAFNMRNPHLALMVMSYIINVNILRKLAEKHFNVDVPTYYCKADTVMLGCVNVRGRKNEQSFHAWAAEKIQAMFVEEEKEASSRIMAQANAILNTADYKEAEKQALIDLATDEIIGVIYRFRNLGEDIIREAIHAATVKGVLDEG